MKKLIKWIKEFLREINSQCPHCGYYCTGKTIFCTKGTNDY